MPNQGHQHRGARGGYDEERLQQLLGRMRAALQLGLRPSPSKDGELRWGNSDAQVQGQAVRAIAAFVAVIPPRPFPLVSLQTGIEEAVAALECLLAVEQEVIYRQAAGASAGLGRATNGRHMLRLLSPLAWLLAPSKTPEVALSAATAIQSILAAVRPQVSSERRMGDDPVWKVLQESDALKHILWRLDKPQGDVGLTECAEILAMVLERWPGARYRVGQVETVRSSLLAHCMSSNEAIAIASLRACQALALCAGAAALQLQMGDSLWEILAQCLHQSRPLLVNREALRLLSLLGRLPSFTAFFNGPHMQAILEGCLRNFNEGSKARLSVVEQGVAVEAAHATAVILRWAGEHHNVLLELGMVKVLFLLLSERLKLTAANFLMYDGGSEKLDAELKSRGKLTSLLRPISWEVLGWVAAHVNTLTSREILFSKPSGGPSLAGITVLACATLVRGLHRSGHASHNSGDDDLVVADISVGEQQISGQELLQICKTVFLLLSSTSQNVSTSTKASLEQVVKLHDYTWLPRLVESLALGHTGPSQVKPESVQTATNLFALACFSCLPECREFLLQGRTLEVVLAIVKIHGNKVLAEKQQLSACSVKWSVVHARAGIAAKSCCEEITEDWEGTDTVLFASLCAFTKLVQGSDWARVVANSLRGGRLDEASCSTGSHGDVVSLLWRLAESTTMASGVRWWAACGLACFNVYGFPSALGREIFQTFDESLFPDITFILRDGSRLLVHGIILAVRCSSLLPRGVFCNERESVGVSAPHEIHLSDRISYRSLIALLEYVYSGVVHVEVEELDELKLLSKRCGLDALTNLLNRRVPEWGLPPDSCDLGPALEFLGNSFADITLRGKPHGDAVCGSACRLENGCSEISTDVHVHRVVLCSRCDYFRALFRSGMRDSMEEAIRINLSKQSIQTLLQFWYTGKLIRLTQGTGWCAWNNLETPKQINYLQSLIELAQLASQWLVANLQEECNLLVLQHIEGCNIHLGPSVITQAAACEQWDLVSMCANCIAPAYTPLRDAGAFENLDEGLRDALRTAHIQSTLSDSELESR